MKLPGLALATLAITALVGGTAAAQVTMQPIPNPPESGKHMGVMHHHHHHWVHHHHHHWRGHHGRHHHMKKAAAAAEAPAPAATPPSK